ncbi:MAG: hypothetical protein ACEQSE_13730 [Candidatus Aquirickettsiella gammari]
MSDNLMIIGTALSIEIFGYGKAHYALATCAMQLGLVIPKHLDVEAFQSFT